MGHEFWEEAPRDLAHSRCHLNPYALMLLFLLLPYRYSYYCYYCYLDTGVCAVASFYMMRLMSQQFRFARPGGSGQCAGEGGKLGLRANACPTLIGEGGTALITPIRLVPQLHSFYQHLLTPIGRLHTELT